MKPVFFFSLIMLFTAACSATPTPEFIPTPTCAYTWAYGPGSPTFEAQVQKSFQQEGISAKLNTSTYGENCGSTFHPMSLDVDVEVVTSAVGDPLVLDDLATEIRSVLRQNLSASDAPNLGKVQLTFTSADGSKHCTWDFDTAICR